MSTVYSIDYIKSVEQRINLSKCTIDIINGLSVTVGANTCLLYTSDAADE